MDKPIPRCDGCGGENPTGAEVCRLCRDPRPRTGDHVTRQFTAYLERPGLYLVSLFADGGATVALAKPPSSWHAAQAMTEMAL